MSNHKTVAIALRKKGLTYSEISKTVPVSKATLSLWLSKVMVPERYAKRLHTKRLRAVRLGWEARTAQRIQRTERITTLAIQEAAHLKGEPLWLVGLALYWAEGHKAKPWATGESLIFTNMDLYTLLIFRMWCTRFLGVSLKDFSYSLYLHDTHRAKTSVLKLWWAKSLDIELDSILVYYKRSKITHIRHNDKEAYRGVFRIRVRRSTDLNRRVNGWTTAMIDSILT